MGETEFEAPVEPGEAAEPTESAEPTEAPAAPASPFDDPAVRQLIQEEVAAQSQAQVARFQEQFYADLQQQAEQQGYEQQPQQYGQSQQPQFQLDPLDEEGFQQNLGALIAWNNQQLLSEWEQRQAQMLDQRLAPFYEQQQQTQNAQGMEWIKDVLSDTAAREGDFNQDAAQRAAMSFLPAAEQRYGNTTRAAEVALREAASYIRKIEAEAEKRGADKLRNQLSGGRDLSAEPGTAGAAVSVGSGIKATNELEWAQEWVNRQNRH